MIELTFLAGSEIVKFKIEGKKITFSAKNTNYDYLEWNPLGLSADKITKLRVKKGEKWYREYLEAEEKFKKMKTEKEIADDLIIDYAKMGMKCTERK